MLFDQLLSDSTVLMCDDGIAVYAGVLYSLVRELAKGWELR